MTDITPKKLKIYYGWPSSFNYTPTNQWDLDNVADDMGQYDMFVLGAGLQDSTHSDHNNTKTILGKTAVANTDFYGYVDTTDSQTTLESQIDDWDAMGNRLVGIFCDKFGYDWNVTRTQQNDLVSYIHTKGLRAFVNAWAVDDVFVGTPAHKLNTDDWYLAESFQIVNGNFRSELDWKTRSDKMVTHSSAAKMACVTTYGTAAFDQDKMDYAYFSCLLYGFDAFGWGEKDFAASTALAPLRTRKSFNGTKHDGAITSSMGVYERNTNVGIHVDTINHTVSTTLD